MGGRVIMLVLANGHQRSRLLSGLLRNVHAFPESDTIPDTLGVRSGVRIGPGRVRVERVIHANMEVARGALDRTDRRVRAHLKQAQVDCRRREVVVSLDDNCLVACGYGGVFPDC